MSVSAAKVRSVCTASEAALVRASRQPQLARLTAAEVKRSAARARALADKWVDLSRQQSRSRSRRVGFGGADANSQLKAEIFRDALAAFTARLDELESPRGKASKARKSPPKPARQGEHRAARASVRQKLTTKKLEKNAARRNQTPPAGPAASPPAAAGSAAAEPAARPPAPAHAAPPPAAPLEPPSAPSKPPRPKKRAIAVAELDRARQRAAVTAAKQSRIARSGKNTRLRGHASAGVRRSQARRDAKN